MSAKTMLAGACALAMSFAVSAADWFNANIGNYTEWPTTTGITGGSWINTEDTTLATGETGSKYLVIDTDDDLPLTFQATNSKTVGDAANDVVIDATVKFVAVSELPEVDDNAKAGVIAYNGYYYILAKDGTTNAWVNTEIAFTADTTIAVKITAVKKDDSTSTVTYKLGDNDGIEKAVVATNHEFKNVALSGSGELSVLSAAYAPNMISFTVEKPANATVKVTVDGTELSSPYSVEKGKKVTVTYTAKQGFLFANGKDTMSKEVVVNETQEIAKPEGSDATEAKAKIGTTYYLTLNAALEKAEAGDAVTLLDDVALADQLVISKAITLDLGEKTLASTFAGYAIDIQGVTPTFKNGPINTSSNGVLVAGEAGVKFIDVDLKSGGRAVNMSNDGVTVVNGPGELFVDADSTITSTNSLGILCGNGDRDNARSVNIAGKVTAVDRALQLSGNNTAVISGELTTTGDDIAMYYGGTWYQNGNGNPGTQPTLTVSGKIAANATDGWALFTDPGDKIGVNLTIADDAVISGGAYGVLYQVAGKLNVNGGTLQAGTAALYLERDAADMNVAVNGGTIAGPIVSVAEAGGEALTGFVKGGTFTVDPSAYLVSSGYVYKSGDTWVAGSVSGSGTAEDPYQIAKESDFRFIKVGPAGAGVCYKLMNDIALTGEWTGIGAFDAKDNLKKTDTYTGGAFQGVFDGGNFTISGLKLQRGDYVGFFGSTYGATIKNVKISLGSETGFGETSTSTDTASNYGGGIVVGVSVNTTIENCETLKTDTYTTFKATKAAAGIVGYAAKGTVVKGCVNNVNIETANTKCGGLMAVVENNGDWGFADVVIDNCTNNGDVYCSASGTTYAAGLASYVAINVNFKGANVVTGTLTQKDGSAYSVAALYKNNVILDDGATFTVPAANMTVNKSAVDGLFFATVDGDVATLVKNDAVVAPGAYKVMAAGAPYTMDFTDKAIGDNVNITFDNSLVTTWAPTITGADDAQVVSDANGYTLALKGEGTAESPYEFSTIRTIAAVGSDPSAADQYYKMTADLEVPQGATITGGKSIIIDLGGKTLSYPNGTTSTYIITVNDGNTLVASNGTVTTTGRGVSVAGNLTLGDGLNLNTDCRSINCLGVDNNWGVDGQTDHPAIVTIAKGATVTHGTGDNVAVFVRGSAISQRKFYQAKAILNVYGTIIDNTSTNEVYGITGNGGNATTAEINFYDGSVYTCNTADAIQMMWLPQANLNLYGGTLTSAGNGIYIRCGNVNVPADSTVKMIANGTDANALILDRSGTGYPWFQYPELPVYIESEINATIAGGEFTATGAAISSVATGSGKTALANFVSGGYFKEDIAPATVIAGYKTAASATKTGYYEVVPDVRAKIGTEMYLTLKDAVDAAKDDDTIVMLANDEGTTALTVNANFTVDIAGFEVTIGGATINADKTLTLVNSQIEAKKGWLKTTGAIAVNGTLDMSNFAMGAAWGGIHEDSAKVDGGAIRIGAAGLVKFIADSGAYLRGEAICYSPNFMVANLPGTFGETATGAKIQLGDKGTWTYNGSLWAVENAVATAYLSGVTRTSKVGEATTCAFTEAFASLAEAVAASDANQVVTLLAAASADDIATDKNISLDLNGQTLTLANGKTLTIGQTSTITNSKTNEGGLTIDGQVIVADGASLDFSTLNWGAGGLATGSATGSLQVKGSVAFWAGNDPRYMQSLNENFFAGSSDGAKFTSGDAQYTYGNGVWAEGSEKAVAKIGTYGYATLADAFNAVVDGQNQTVTVLAATSLTEAYGLSKSCYFDINGQEVTLSASLTIGGWVNFLNTNSSAGWLKIDAPVIVVNGCMADLSNFNIGTWLHGVSDDSTCGITLNDGAMAFFQSGAGSYGDGKFSPNWMYGNYPPFFNGAVGANAQVWMGTWNDLHKWTYNATEKRFVKTCAAGAEVAEVAKATVEADHRLGEETPTQFTFVESFTALADAVAAVKAGETVTLAADAELANLDAVTKDTKIDANGFDLVLDNAAMTLNYNVTIVSATTTATKGVKNLAQITIAADKTLDLSTLGWAEGIIDAGQATPTARFTLNAGATYKQKINAWWDDALTNIFATVEGYKIVLNKTDTVATITTEEVKSAGPTPGSGSETKVEPVAGQENTYKVEPTGSGTTVLVDNVKSGDTLVIDATVTEIGVNGGASAGATIKVMNSDKSAEVPTSAMKGWNGNSFDTALDPEAKVEVTTSEGTVSVPVEPTLIEETATEKPLVVGDNVETKVQAIPGLTYKLVRDTAPGGSFTKVADSGKAESGTATITLKDTNKPEGKAFYKIQVTK